LCVCVSKLIKNSGKSKGSCESLGWEKIVILFSVEKWEEKLSVE